MTVAGMTPHDAVGAEALTQAIDELIDDAQFAYLQRGSEVCAPNVSFEQLRALDERLSADIDGVRVAADAAWSALRRIAAEPSRDSAFVAAVLALESDDRLFDELLDRAAEDADVLAGLTDAVGWVPLRIASSRIAAVDAAAGSAKALLQIAAVAEHRSSSSALPNLSSATSKALRRRTIAAIGVLGRTDLLQAVEQWIRDPAADTRFEAAKAVVMLGGRDHALQALRVVALSPSGRRTEALRLSTLIGEPAAAHELLMALEGEADAARLRIIGSGTIGDAKYVPWLIDQMSNPATARIAGEAFVHITGADFNLDQLESMPPEGYDDGPTDDPDDDDVELPEDIALPWPDVEHVKAWWMEHRSGFTPGHKLFLGKPVTPEHCVHVLKTGYQRQRVIAAHYRSLIQPGTLLFPTSAPAWRQQKLLDSM